MASRSYAPWLAQLRHDGYRAHLVFLWLPNADVAAARVADRVRSGGHDIPEPTIRRRYAAGLKNLFQLYQPLADSWQVVDNSEGGVPAPIATGGTTGAAAVFDPQIWQSILQRAQQ